MISLASETISAKELDAAAEFLKSGKRLTKSEQTVLFEEEFAAKVGASHAVFVNSGSSANLLVAAALKESGRLRNNSVVCPFRLPARIMPRPIKTLKTSQQG